MYLAMIKGLGDSDWKSIFDALYDIQETRAYETQVEAGGGTEEFEPLLPVDPPSPPPS
jgi:hypothetical protein